MIYQLEEEERFPRRIKLSARAVGWIEDEVLQWLEHRIVSSRPQPDGRAKAGCVHLDVTHRLDDTEHVPPLSRRRTE